MAVRIVSVEQFRACFDEGNTHEFVTVCGILKFRRVITRLKNRRGSIKERYLVWSMVDGSTVRCTLDELVGGEKSLLGGAMGGGALFLDD